MSLAGPLSLAGINQGHVEAHPPLVQTAMLLLLLAVAFFISHGLVLALTDYIFLDDSRVYVKIWDVIYWQEWHGEWYVWQLYRIEWSSYYVKETWMYREPRACDWEYY